MKNLLVVTLIFVSFAVSSPSDSAAVNCQKIEKSAVANLFTGVPAFISMVVFIPVPAASIAVFGAYIATATKISMDYSHQGCGVEKTSPVSVR